MAGYGFGNGERCRGRAGMGAPGRLKVDGGEVAAGGDSAVGERGLDLVAVDSLRQENHVNKPAYGALGKVEGRESEAGDVLKQGPVALGGGGAEDENFLDAG